MNRERHPGHVLPDCEDAIRATAEARRGGCAAQAQGQGCPRWCHLSAALSRHCCGFHIGCHVWTCHSKQRTAALRLRGRDERAGQPREQLPATLECGAQPGTACDPAQSRYRTGVARCAALGIDPVLVQGPERWTQTDQCQGRNAAHTAQLPRGLSQATLHRAGRRLLRMEGDQGTEGEAGLWENWKDPKTGEWIRTFVIITTDANTLVADIHDRMPVILAPSDYARWLGDEADPHDLIRPFPSEAMRMWPISTRVNKPENDDASILDPVAGADAA